MRRHLEGEAVLPDQRFRLVKTRALEMFPIWSGRDSSHSLTKSQERLEFSWTEGLHRLSYVP